MDKRIISNGNVTVWVVPAAGIADYEAPTATEINAGLDVTDALAWDASTFPAATASDDQDDRSMRDAGNATTRGVAQFEASLNFFRPKTKGDTASDYGKAYEFFRIPGVDVYLITRILQGPEGRHKDAAAGEWISVYKFVTDGWTDDFEGDDSVKYAVGFMTQGEVITYTQVKNSAPVEVTNASASTSVDVGDHIVLRATLGGKRATQVVEWSSSAPNIATVSGNGVVTGVAAGTASITADHPAASAPSKAISVTVS